jgi:CRP-like cAMP-binding protein
MISNSRVYVLSERTLAPAEISLTDRAGAAVPAKKASSGRLNGLLASLPHDQFGLLSPHMIVEQLGQGIVLTEAGEETENVYFPHSGMLSLQAVMKDGRGIETATVGREGVVGAMAGLGAYISNVRVVVQLQAEVTRITAVRFRKAATGNSNLRNMCVSYNEVLLSQARITAACNAVHLIEARFCRWFLHSADAADSDTIVLTHQVLAEMLGSATHVGD